MITPLVTEQQWLAELCDLPELPLWSSATCVISPHPDDETLGAGGLIFSLRAEAVPVTVVAVTDGENAYENEIGLGPQREREQTDALKVLGVDDRSIIRLRLPDSQLINHEKQLHDLLLDIVQPGMRVIAPWTGDFHPDHEACGRVAQEIARCRNASLIFYFFWTWHRGETNHLHGLRLRQLSLNEAAFGARDQALRCHYSQLAHPDGMPILPQTLLAPMKRRFEVFFPQ